MYNKHSNVSDMFTVTILILHTGT